MEIEKKKRNQNLFLQGLVMGLIVFIAKCLGYNLSAFDYLKYLLLYMYGFSPEWLVDILDIFIGSLSTVFILLYLYMKGYINILRKSPKKNKNEKSN